MVKAFGVEVVRTTLEVALTCEELGKFRWIAKSGKLRSMMLPDGWLTVDEAQATARAEYLLDEGAVVEGDVHGVAVGCPNGWGNPFIVNDLRSSK